MYNLYFVKLKFTSISKLGIIGFILLNFCIFSFFVSDVFANKKDLPPVYDRLGIDKDDVDFRVGTFYDLKLPGDLYMNNNRIESVADPEGSSDAATKGYVDDEIEGLQEIIDDKPTPPTCTGEGEALRWDEGEWQCSNIDGSDLVEDVDDGLPDPSSCGGGTEVLHWEDGDWKCRELDISDLSQGSGIAPAPPSCDGEFESLVWTNDGWSCEKTSDDCSINWEDAGIDDLVHGEIVTAYKSEYAGDCPSEDRECVDGFLTGEYKYKECKESEVHDVSSLEWGGCGGEPLRSGDYRDACRRFHDDDDEIDKAICNLEVNSVQDTCRFTSDEEWDINSGSLPQNYCEELMCVLKD